MFSCQQNLINPDKEIKAILEFLCTESVKLSNCAIYYSRQLLFKTGKVPSKYDLQEELSVRNKNLHYQAFYSDTAQQVLRDVAESFKGFFRLLKAVKAGKVIQKPKPPKYRKGGMAVVTYTGRSVKLENGLLRFPLGSKVKAWFGIDAFYLPMPSNLDHKSIREYKILPRNGCFYIEFIYKTEAIQVDANPSNALMIDHGVDNWLTCVSNVGTSFIVDGKHLKSLNQGYNKRVASLMEGKANGYWSKRLARITEKRNRTMRDAINKAAKKVINHCLQNRIGTIVFGWNKGQKDGANMGKKTNQKFVQIPTGRLKERIKQLCEQYGIQFLQTEESYTSKASFIDRDFLPAFGEKPEGWKESGKRVKRGLYRTAQGYLINADCNGAANMGRKNVAVMLGLDLSGISRGALSAPLKFKLWTTQKS
jgi:IS605 OrfB family transposase